MYRIETILPVDIILTQNIKPSRGREFGYSENSLSRGLIPSKRATPYLPRL
jgi:hypothetical protein